MTFTIIVFLLVFALTLAAGLSATLIVDRNRRIRRARLIGLGASPRQQTLREQNAQTTKQRRERRQEYRSDFERQLQKSGLSVSIAQVAALNLAASTGLSLIAFLLQNSDGSIFARMVFAVLIGLLSSLAATSLLLRILEARRIAKFRASLPEALETMARSLRAGRAASDAVGLIGTSGQDLLAVEFRRCRADIEHGSTLRTAIEALASRVDIPDVHFISSAISLQHTSGGNLAETLDIAALSLRQFRQLEAKSRALSAEVRMSAAILTALPVIVAGALFTLSPDYVSRLTEDPRGRMMVAYAILSLGGGLFLMKRMEKIDD